jgi:prolipoprotein diacylglyceryltransferase
MGTTLKALWTLYWTIVIVACVYFAIDCLKAPNAFWATPFLCIVTAILSLFLIFIGLFGRITKSGRKQAVSGLAVSSGVPRRVQLSNDPPPIRSLGE